MTQAGEIGDTRRDPAPDALPWPSPRQAWIAVALLMIAYILSFVDRTILALLVQPIKTSLHLSDTEIGVIQGPAFGLFFTLTTLLFGFLTDAVRRTRMIASGVLLWSLMTVASGLSATFGQLLGARTGAAVGQATLSPSAPSLIADYFPPARRTLPITLYIAAGSSGTALGLVAGGFLGHLVSSQPMTFAGFGPFEPWQVIFFVVSIPGFIVSLLFLTVREPERRDGGQAQPTMAELGRVLKSRRAIIVPQAIGICLYQLQVFAFTAWVPTFYMRVHHWSMSDVGLKYGIILLVLIPPGSIAGSWLARILYQRGRRDANLLTAALFLVILTIPVVSGFLVKDAWLSVALLAMFGFCGSTPSAAALASLQEIIPNRLRGRATAFYYTALGLVSITVGPFIIGFMNDHLFANGESIGSSLAIVSAATLPLAAIMVLIAAAQRRKLEWEN